MSFNTKPVFGISEKQRSKRELKNQKILAPYINIKKKVNRSNQTPIIELEKTEKRKLG